MLEEKNAKFCYDMTCNSGVDRCTIKKRVFRRLVGYTYINGRAACIIDEGKGGGMRTIFEQAEKMGL